MPLFFLLSGFCLTLGYGKKSYSGCAIFCVPCKLKSGCSCCHLCKCCETDSNLDRFNSTSFYLRRLTRILPVYYFCLIFAAILIPFGHTNFTAFWYNGYGSFVAVFLVQTWILIFGVGPNEPSWTISTLFFFYLLYPR